MKPGDTVTLKEDCLFCLKRGEWIFQEMRDKDMDLLKHDDEPMGVIVRIDEIESRQNLSRQ